MATLAARRQLLDILPLPCPVFSLCYVSAYSSLLPVTIGLLRACCAREGSARWGGGGEGRGDCRVRFHRQQGSVMQKRNLTWSLHAGLGRARCAARPAASQPDRQSWHHAGWQDRREPAGAAIQPSKPFVIASSCHQDSSGTPVGLQRDRTLRSHLTHPTNLASSKHSVSRTLW